MVGVSTKRLPAEIPQYHMSNLQNPSKSALARMAMSALPMST